MGKALGIDYGTKRTGIAITDAMQIIASGLTTVATHTLDDFISNFNIEEVRENKALLLERQESLNQLVSDVKNEELKLKNQQKKTKR